MFVGLHNVRYALMSIKVRVGAFVEVISFRHGCINRGHPEKSTPLKQDNLLSRNLLCKCAQEFLNNGQIRDHPVNNASPSLIQSLVPNAASKCFEAHPVCAGCYHVASFVVDSFAVLVLDKIHFVHEGKDLRGGGILFQGGNDRGVGVEIAVDFTRFDVKDVDEDLSIAEDVFALSVEVGVGEGILASHVV